MLDYQSEEQGSNFNGHGFFILLKSFVFVHKIRTHVLTLSMCSLFWIKSEKIQSMKVKRKSCESNNVSTMASTYSHPFLFWTQKILEAPHTYFKHSAKCYYHMNIFLNAWIKFNMEKFKDNLRLHKSTSDINMKINMLADYIHICNILKFFFTI